MSSVRELSCDGAGPGLRLEVAGFTPDEPRGRVVRVWRTHDPDVPGGEPDLELPRGDLPALVEALKQLSDVELFDFDRDRIPEGPEEVPE
jgi:hypothetical protein